MRCCGIWRGRKEKQIEFRTEGLEVQADRLVLQALKDPVMHLSAQRGVRMESEPERERAAVGKPPAGSIRLQIESRGDPAADHGGGRRARVE